jgi:phenylacetaldehyde dehydrogenase
VTGTEAGTWLVEHPGVDKISFTGSTAVGRQIAMNAAGRFKKCTLELGGKSPVVIFPDADLEQAIPGAAWAIFGNHGQNCCAGSRLYVHRSVYDKVVEGVVQIAQSIRLGPGLDPASQMGPLVSENQLQRALGYVQAGRRDGASVVTGGSSLGAAGYYMQPTVLADVTPQMRVVREEIFAPVLVARRFDHEAEVLLEANDSEYGLGASVWTTDINRVHRFIGSFKAGTVWVNVHNVLDAVLPFGGIKSSGIGHDLGEEAIRGNLQTKATVIRLK